MRRAGLLFFRIDGAALSAKGSFTYSLGAPQREAIVGADRVHGYKETPTVAFIEGVVTDEAGLNLASLISAENATVTLELVNGKTIVLRNAWYAGDGNVTTEEGEVNVRFEGLGAEEIAA